MKLLNIHYGHKILVREPALATIGFADIARGTSRNIAPRAIVNELTVDIKCLSESYVYNLAVGSH